MFHGSSLSRFGASGKPGAVHRRARPAVEPGRAVAGGVRTSPLAQARWGAQGHECAGGAAAHAPRRRHRTAPGAQAPRPEETHRAFARNRPAVAVRAPHIVAGGAPAVHRARRQPRPRTTVERLRRALSLSRPPPLARRPDALLRACQQRRAAGRARLRRRGLENRPAR